MEELELCFPHFPNRSCLIVREAQTQHLLRSLVFGGLSALITFLNLLVILSVACFRQLQTSTHRILLSLAVSDFLLGAVLIPITFRIFGVCWVWGDAACVLYSYMVNGLIIATIGSMVLVSVDRYIAVADPMHYKRRMSPCKVNLSICLTWAYAALFCLITMHSVFNRNRPVRYLGECNVISVVEINVVLCWVMPFCIIFIFYAHIFRVVVMKSKFKCSHRSTSQGKQRSELKAARNLGSVMVVFLLCYLPVNSIAFSPSMVDFQNNYFMVAVLIMYLNGAFNPLLYVLIYPGFRKAFTVILTLKILSSEPVVL